MFDWNFHRPHLSALYRLPFPPWIALNKGTHYKSERRDLGCERNFTFSSVSNSQASCFS